MDFASPFVNIIDTYLISPLVRRIMCLRSSLANVNDMQTAVQNLKARREDKQSDLKKEENAGQVETKEATNWFEDVEAIKKEADAIEEKYNQRTSSCARGYWCVNFWSHYKLSKRSLDLKGKAEGSFNQQFVLARPTSPKSVREIESDAIIDENQPSTQRMLRKMLDCIGDSKIRIIGVYGMGGVGKTTLAKEVNNHFKENACSGFETVKMVTVSATPNIRDIQTSILKHLGLDLPKDIEDDDTREKLFDALSKKKFLLILDDVWDRLKLDVVGIPHPQKKNQKGSKILVTSRSKDACTDMDAEITMKVEPLSREESWNLFLERARCQDVIAAADNRVKRSAEEIVGRCKGLPLAIVTVARAMANRSGVGEWEDAAREMEKSAIDLRGMEEEVLVPLKFSFDRLQNDMLRSLFLYCACFPEDCNIWLHIDILNYCIGEGLVDKLGSFRAASNKGEALIGSLKTACMLEDGEHKGCVRMHDMMRQLAYWITSPPPPPESSSDSSSTSSPTTTKFLIRTGESFEDAPQAEEWFDATRVSLMRTQIEKLPELGRRCPKLTTFLLRWNMRILTLPPTNFFQHMDHLTVLDLSNQQELEYLPDSLSCLVNLRMLRLRWCYKLRALPAAQGMPRKLQYLDLLQCRSLDQKILLGSECVGGDVSNLRYLDVGMSAVSIRAGEISHLLKLEELYLFGADKIKWRVSIDQNEKGLQWCGADHNRKRGQRDDDDNDGNKIVEEEERISGVSSSSDLSINDNIIDVGELSNLTNLTFLSISFQDIIISDWFEPLAQKIRWLSLRHCTVIKQDVIQAALKESQNLSLLEIYNCPGLTCVPAHGVKSLTIEDCEDLEKVSGGAEAYPDSFQRLHVLYLLGLPKLERICVGVAPLNCLSELVEIEIERCNGLKMVFTKGMPHLFNNLECITVGDCNGMEVIIEAGEEDNGGVISPFPKLNNLILYNLPALTDICSNHILHCSLIENVEVKNCPRLKKDPLHIRNTDGLLVIEEGEWKGKFFEEEIQTI